MAPSSSQSQSQTLYMPIAGPPTPAPSPGPSAANSPTQPHHHHHHHHSIIPGPFGILSPQANPTLRREYLTAVLRSCTPTELLFISTTIAPLLKRDFLASLPAELALHVLSFIDDPKTLARAAQVSTHWRKLVADEWVWKRMCLIHAYDDWEDDADLDSSITSPGSPIQIGSSLHNPVAAFQSFGHPDALRDKHHQSPDNDDEPLEEMEKFAHHPMDPALEWLIARKRQVRRLQQQTAVSNVAHPFQKYSHFSYRKYFRDSYITMQNWRHGGHLLRSHHIPVVTPDSGVITSLALDSDWVVVGLANSKIHVFSARTGVLARTLVGHESGVWGVCLVSKAGQWIGNPTSSESTPVDGNNPSSSATTIIAPTETGYDDGRWDFVRGNASSSRTSRHSRRNGRGQLTGLAALSSGVSGMGLGNEPLDHRVPPSLRIALGLEPLSGTGEDNEGVFDEDAEEARRLHEANAHGITSSSPRSRSPSIGQGSNFGSYRTATGSNQSDDGSTYELDPPASKWNDMCCASQGWGQPNALVVSGGCDKVLRVWDIQTGYCIYALPGHTSTIRCIRVLHNRPIAVTGSRDSTLRVWDVQRGRCLRVLSGHSGSVRCLDVHGNKVVSGSYDTTCRLWDVDTGECLHVLRGHFHQIYSVAYDGVRIASGGLDTTVRVWSAETGECIALLTGHTALVCQLQLSPTILATGGSDGRVITFSLSTYTALHRIAAHDSSVTSLQFDKHFLVTGGNDGRVRLFEMETGNYVRELSEGSECVWKVAFGKESCAVMCKRGGKTVMEIWSMRPSQRGWVKLT
ncbi:WD40 repeat-like protein [Pluteus cervinus]|uniref:WD40 repeat-like protein n=1 Tax=Pluteus cervinus TaxID=181527 RepID=A0ACD3BBS1_9AGAR|nr:WD40 repeat-like protein [Pluteus cervinus]